MDQVEPILPDKNSSLPESEDFVCYEPWRSNRPVIERYYTHYICKDVFDKPGEHQYVYQHSNGICLVGLATSHLLFERKSEITAISVDFSHSTSASINKRQHNLLNAPAPVGKKKFGAQYAENNTVICTIHVNFGTESVHYVMRACVSGAILEYNTALVDSPELLLEAPTTEGYIAIIKPRFETVKTATSHLAREI